MTPPKRVQQPRRGTKLSRVKVRAFRAKCRERDHIGATLCYGWLWGAVIRARLDLPLPLKGHEPAPSSGDGSRDGLLWSQPEGEYRAWTRELEQRGSSVRDVLGQFVDAYLDSDGDLIRTAELVWGAPEVDLPPESTDESPSTPPAPGGGGGTFNDPRAAQESQQSLLPIAS